MGPAHPFPPEKKGPRSPYLCRMRCSGPPFNPHSGALRRRLLPRLEFDRPEFHDRNRFVSHEEGALADAPGRRGIATAPVGRASEPDQVVVLQGRAG